MSHPLFFGTASDNSHDLFAPNVPIPFTLWMDGKECHFNSLADAWKQMMTMNSGTLLRELRKFENSLELWHGSPDVNPTRPTLKNSLAYHLLRDCLLAQLTQHPVLLKALLNTQDRPLNYQDAEGVKACFPGYASIFLYNDTFRDKPGENLLGEVLQDIRALVKQNYALGRNLPIHTGLSTDTAKKLGVRSAATQQDGATLSPNTIKICEDISTADEWAAIQAQPAWLRLLTLASSYFLRIMSQDILRVIQDFCQGAIKSVDLFTQQAPEILSHMKQKQRPLTPAETTQMQQQAEHLAQITPAQVGAFINKFIGPEVGSFVAQLMNQRTSVGQEASSPSANDRR